MRLYQQLLLFMVAATVLPVAVLGAVLLRTTEVELGQRIRGEQVALARAAAVEASGALMDAVEALGRSAELLDWSQLEPAEQQGALTLLYEQSALVSAVVRVGPEGLQVGSPVARDTAAGGHPAFAVGTERALLEAVPVQALARGEKGQVALSAPFALAGGTGRALALAVKLASGPSGGYAVAQVHLSPLESVLSRVVEPARIAWLTDAEGRVLAHTAQAPLELPPDARAALSGAQGEGEWLASAAALPGRLGMTVVVAEQAAMALAPVHALRRTVVASVGLGLVVLLVGGALFTRRLNGRLGQLAEGARALGQGRLSHRLAVTGSDELSEVAQAFNGMGEALDRAQQQLLGFNDELRRRVELATAELKASQAMLIEAQKLAAVGQLGAGVAHEINNPLAGILGHAQLLLLEKPDGDPDVASLQKIELAARRVKEITANLLRFSQQRQEASRRSLDLRGVVREALTLVQHQLEREEVQLELSLPDAPVRIDGDPGQLGEVVLALVQNARTAMRRSERKALRVSLTAQEGHAQLTVGDSGRGIEAAHLPRLFEPFFTTKDEWSNVGLGLSVSFRVAQEHGGSLEVESEVGQGSSFTVRVPLR